MSLSDIGSWSSIVGILIGIIGLFFGGKFILKIKKNIKNSSNFKKAKFDTKGGSVNIHIGDKKESKDGK